MCEGEPASGERDVHDALAWVEGTLGITQPELATLLGTSPRTLSRWLSAEAGGRRPQRGRT